MKIKYFLVLIIILSSEVCLSQNSEYFDTNKEVFWGINKNSWGGLIGGGVLKFSNKVSDKMYQTIGIEIVNIKHPKENKYSSCVFWIIFKYVSKHKHPFHWVVSF